MLLVIVGYYVIGYCGLLCYWLLWVMMLSDIMYCVIGYIMYYAMGYSIMEYYYVMV